MTLEQPSSLTTSQPSVVAEIQPSGYRYAIAGLTMTLYYTFGLSVFVISPVAPLIMSDYGINRSAASLLVGLVLLLQAGLSIPGGMLAGRVPLKWLIATGALAVSAPVLTFTASSFPVLLGVRAVYGLASAFVLPSIAPLLMQWFHPKEMPLVNGLNLSSISMGIATSAFTAAPLADVLGWKAALSFFGAMSLLGAVAWIVFGKTRRPVQAQSSHMPLKDSLGVLRSRSTILLAIANGAAVGQFSALTTWLPTFYHEVVGMSLNRAAAMMGILPMVGVVSLMLAGAMSTRVRARRPFLLVPGVLMGFAGFGTFLLGDSPLLFVALLTVGFCFWFYQPVLFSIPMELPDVDPASVSLVWGAVISSAGVMGFLSPLFVGALTDITGTYLPAFSVLAVLSWNLATAAIMLPETGK